MGELHLISYKKVLSSSRHVVADAVGGTSVEAHEAALRRIEQDGGKMISLIQLICELQRDWARKETVPAFAKVASEIPGTFAIQLAYDNGHGD